MEILVRTAPGHFPISRYIRPISARSNAVARRLTQDHARSFCTMKAGSARGFCENWPPTSGARQMWLQSSLR